MIALLNVPIIGAATIPELITTPRIHQLQLEPLCRGPGIRNSSIRSLLAESGHNVDL